MGRFGATTPKVDLGRPVEFLRLLWAVAHSLQSMSKRMERDLGVTGPQRLVIRIVGRMSGISAGELAGILHIHPSTLTGILTRLVERGQLARRPDPADRRRTVLSLTPRGRSVDRLKAGTVEAGVRRTLAASTREELEAAVRVLRRLGEDIAAEAPARPK